MFVLDLRRPGQQVIRRGQLFHRGQRLVDVEEVAYPAGQVPVAVKHLPQPVEFPINGTAEIPAQRGQAGVEAGIGRGGRDPGEEVRHHRLEAAQLAEKVGMGHAVLHSIAVSDPVWPDR